MATTVHQPPKLTEDIKPSSSGGGWSGLPSVGGRTKVDDSSPASRTGVWVAMAAITMTFAAFTSAMIVRQGSSYDWQHFALPSVLYLDTALLLASSLVLELARKKVQCFCWRGAETAVGSDGLPVDDFGIGFAVCRRPIHGMAQAEIGRTVSGDHSQQLLLLSVYGAARSSHPGRIRRADDGDLAVQQAASDVAHQHAEHGVVLLALHGCTVDLPFATAVDANLVLHGEDKL